MISQLLLGTPIGMLNWLNIGIEESKHYKEGGLKGLREFQEELYKDQNLSPEHYNTRISKALDEMGSTNRVAVNGLEVDASWVSSEETRTDWIQKLKASMLEYLSSDTNEEQLAKSRINGAIDGAIKRINGTKDGEIFFDERGSIDYTKDGKVTFYGKMHGTDSTMSKEELENFRSFFDGLAINYKNHYLLFLTEDDMSLEEFKAEFKKLNKEVELEYKNSKEAKEALIDQQQVKKKRDAIKVTSKSETYDINKDKNMQYFAQKLQELEQKRGIDVLKLLEKISNKKAIDIKV